MIKTTWRSFNTPLSQILSTTEYFKIETLLNELTMELNKQLNNPQIIQQAIKLETITSSGKFRDDYTKLVGKPHLKWSKITGNKAKYQRMIIEQLRSNLLSLKEKQLTAEVCDKNNWDANKTKEIRDELVKLKLYPTDHYLKNILSSKRMPILPASLKAQLNFTNGDQQIIKQEIIVDKQVIKSEIQVNGEWIELLIPIPKHLRDNTGHCSKPILQKNNNGEIIVRMAYEVIVQQNTDNNYVMGVDLGKIKPFSAAINYNDGSYSSELTFSKELKRLNDKHIVLNKELSRLFKKSKRIESLLKGKPDSYLTQHYEDIIEQAHLIKSKRTKLKDHASWLIARDIIAHAVIHKVSVIKLEELGWLGSRGGKWDYALTQSKIKELAELAGIQVINVDSRDSSHTDPFSNKYVEPNAKRLIVSDDYELDRDYVAGLELSRRAKKSRSKNIVKSRVLKRKSCRDKHFPTPKRPKLVKRKSVLKKVKQESKLASGVPITVVSSAETRLNTTTSEFVKNSVMDDYYTQVLRS